MRVSLTVSVIAVFLLMNTAIVKGEEAMIADGKTVKFEYLLTVNGEKVDSSEGKGPLEYVHGTGTIIKGLETQLTGLKVGDERTVTIGAEDAYGAVNPEAFQEVPKNIFPAEFEVKQGMVIPLQNNEGQTIPAVVAEIKEETIVLNFNHPLAGQELTFDVKIIEVN